MFLYPIYRALENDDFGSEYQFFLWLKNILENISFDIRREAVLLYLETTARAAADQMFEPH